MSVDKFNDNMDEDYFSKLIQVKNFLQDKSSIAGMGQIVVSSKEKPIVGTTALATCWGIVFYDRKNKKAYVGHAAPSVYMKTLNQMINMLDPSTEQIEYCIVPGWDNYHGFGRKTVNLNLCDEEKNPEYHMQLTLENSSKFHFTPLRFDLKIKENGKYGNYFYEFAFNANTLTNVADYLFFDTPILETDKWKKM